MAITLDEVEKTISIILGLAALGGFLFRKFIWPKIKAALDLIRYIPDIPKKIGYLEELVTKDLLATLRQEVIALHKFAYVNSYKLGMIFDDSKSNFFECDPEGNCVWTNSNLQTLFQLDSDQMLGYSWMTGLHPDDVQATFSLWKATITNGLPYRSRYRIILSDHRVVYCEAVALSIKDPLGKVLSILGKVVQISKEDFFNTKTDPNSP